jgi:hypothetical protein
VKIALKKRERKAAKYQQRIRLKMGQEKEKPILFFLKLNKLIKRVLCLKSKSLKKNTSSNYLPIIIKKLKTKSPN